MKVVFDRYGRIYGTPETDDYWGQGDDLTVYLNVQFLDGSNNPITLISKYTIEVVVERPDGLVSPALLMSKVNDDNSNLTVGRLIINNWITEVAGRLKFDVRLKESNNGVTTTKVTGICYRVIGKSIDPADQTITDAQYQALIDALNSKEDLANKSGTLDPTSTSKYVPHKLLHDYVHDRIVLINTLFVSISSLETEIYKGIFGTFNKSGLYSCKIGNGTSNDTVLVLINYSDVLDDYNYHATIFNGSFIEMMTGTVDTEVEHLVMPATQYKYDLTKIGFANNGTLSGLSTTAKNTLVAAINEICLFLGSTDTSSFSSSFDTPDSIVVCLNECREYIAEFIDGTKAVAKAVKATQDEDGNNIKNSLASKQTIANLYDGLDSADATKYLSAKQGKILKDLIDGKKKAVNYSTIETMITGLNSADNKYLNVGDDVYILALEVPDFWVVEIDNNSVPYTYTTTSDFLNTLKTDGYVQVGYYKIVMLETEKVDLTDYQPKGTFVLDSDSTEITHTYQLNQEKSYSNDSITSISINVPSGINMGFYSGANFKIGSTPPSFAIVNNSLYPLKIIKLGVPIESFTPSANTTVTTLIFNDGINTYLQINEVM